MKLVRFCVDHPVAVCMLVLLGMLLGVLTLSLMEVALLPDISVPTLVVVTPMPQAGASEVAAKITRPLEQLLNGVSDVKSMTSRSQEGVSQIQLEFAWGKDIDLAVMEVKEKLYRQQLPGEAGTPYIWRWNPASEPIFRVDIYDREGGSTLSQLKELAVRTLQPRIERIPGVGAVTVVGGAEQEIRVTVSRDRLRAKNIDLLQVIEAFRRENLDHNAGHLDIGRRRCAVRVLGKANTVAQLADMVLATRKHPLYDQAELIRLRDVADIELSTQETETCARINGKASIGLLIGKSSGGNVVEVTTAVKNELARLTREGELPERLALVVSRDDSDYIVRAQNVVLSNIWQGCVLAVALLLLFVRDLRSSFLTVISIPFSIIAAFTVLYALGLSRNILTLGGLSLASGMVLDNSIVLMENLYHHLAQGKKAKSAAIDGTCEVALGVLASTLTTVLVFLPLLFMQGMIREIFKDLALAIIAAIVFSFVIGILLIPCLGSRLARPRLRPERMGRGKRYLLACCDRCDALLENALGFLVRAAIASWQRRLGITVTLAALCLWSITQLPGRDFIPRGKVKEVQVHIEPKYGTSLAELDAISRRVEATLARFGVDSFADKEARIETVTAEVERRRALLFARVRFMAKPGHSFARPWWQQAWDWLTLQPWLAGAVEEVPYSRHEILTVVERLRDRLQEVPADRLHSLRVNPVEKINPQGATPLQISLVPRRPELWPAARMREYVERHLLPAVATVPGAIYFRLSDQQAVPEIELDLDSEAAGDVGIDTSRAAYTVQTFVHGMTPLSIYLGGTPVQVRVQGKAGERSSVDDIGKIPLLTPGATWVTLGQIGRLYQQVSQTQIECKDKQQSVLLEANQIPYSLSGRTLGDIIDDIDRRLAQPDFPAAASEKFADHFFYHYEGQAKELIESSRQAWWALVLAIVLIYFVMCCQFESLVDPLLVLVTIPLSFPGIALLLHWSGEEYSLSAMVGFICLGGIVVNNGIILIEFLTILRRRGMELDEALVAASKRKLRSLLITSLTSIIGMVPIALGAGEGSELYRGCCAVILGGLLVSTPLTLIGLPVLYRLLLDIKEVGSMYWLRFTRSLAQRK